MIGLVLIGLGCIGILVLGVYAAGQESFRRDVHVCDVKYKDPEVRALCVELDLHKEEFARFVSHMYNRKDVPEAHEIRQRTGPDEVYGGFGPGDPKPPDNTPPDEPDPMPENPGEQP